jgi:hypothetical protein
MSIKLALKYAQLRDVESMRAVARAHQNRNLGDFERALKEYHKGGSSFISCFIRITSDFSSRIVLKLDN